MSWKIASRRLHLPKATLNVVRVLTVPDVSQH